MSKTETVPFLAVVVKTINPKTGITREQVCEGRFANIDEARGYYLYAVSEIIDEDFETGAETRHKIVGVELHQPPAVDEAEALRCLASILSKAYEDNREWRRYAHSKDERESVEGELDDLDKASAYLDLLNARLNAKA
jgi:hypothetical protein